MNKKDSEEARKSLSVERFGGCDTQGLPGGSDCLTAAVMDSRYISTVDEVTLVQGRSNV